MNTWVLTTIMGFGGMFYIIWMLKKELPKRDERKKQLWDAEVKNKQKIQEYYNKEDLKIQKIANEEKKQNKKALYVKDNKQKDKQNFENGKKYESFVAEHFRKLNYTVWEHGKEKGIVDKNIDLFIMNKEEVFFVQCKYYRKSKVDHNKVKATRTDIREYMQNNIELTKLIKERKKKILYVIPKECLTPGAWRYIKENNEIMEYKVIPMEA